MKVAKALSRSERDACACGLIGERDDESPDIAKRPAGWRLDDPDGIANGVHLDRRRTLA